MSEQENLEKSGRLMKLTHLLYRNPRGLTAQQLAQQCDISVRQVYRDLDTLEATGVPVTELEGDRWAIIEGHFLPPIHFNLEEAVALVLAARLLARYSDDNNPRIIDALAKLANTLPQAMSDQVHTAIESLTHKPYNPDLTAIFSTITRGWAERRKVLIRYLSAGREEVREHVIATYLLEPSAQGYATHVIGHSSQWDGLRTFKLERIRAAYLTDERYEIPADFDPGGLLNTAWSIMYGPELQEVRLRFAPSAVRRVKESHWHASEQVDDLPDGGCLYRVSIAHPLEMKWWIRSWGPQVIVEAPASLRREMAEEAQQLVEMYGEGGVSDERGTSA